MASNLRVDQITASTTGSVSIGTATFTGGLSGDITGLNVTGVITATTLNQNVTGVVTATGGFVVGTGASISSPATNVLALGTNNSERVRITSGGNVQIANGNLVFSTSGTGIDFSATGEGSGTMTSELLDDYEEGTWTPTVGGTTTYTTQEGRYTKIGRMVHLVGVLRINTIGTGSQNTVSGLPFPNGTPGQATVNINYYSSSNVATTWISGYVEPNTSNFRFSGNDGNANAADANISFLSTSTGIWFSLTYQV